MADSASSTAGGKQGKSEGTTYEAQFDSIDPSDFSKYKDLIDESLHGFNVNEAIKILTACQAAFKTDPKDVCSFLVLCFAAASQVKKNFAEGHALINHDKFSKLKTTGDGGFNFGGCRLIGFIIAGVNSGLAYPDELNNKNGNPVFGIAMAGAGKGTDDKARDLNMELYRNLSTSQGLLTAGDARITHLTAFLKAFGKFLQNKYMTQ